MSDLNEIHRALGRIEGKLDAQAERADQKDAADLTRDKRLTKLETRVNRAGGIAAFVAFVAAIIVKPLFDLFLAGRS